jgi:hypothetical protein
MTTEPGPYETGSARVARWLPYLTLGASTLLTMLDPDPGLRQAPLPVTLALVAGTAAWLFWFVTLHPR